MRPGTGRETGLEANTEPRSRKPAWWLSIVTAVSVVALLDSYPTFAEESQSPAPDLTAGGNSYFVCGTCHGAQGEGNSFVNAPRLAGQQGWYFRRQMKNFQQGLRGAAAGDTFGAQMAAMSSMLADDAAIANVVAYIASLPVAKVPSTISGDTDRGKDLFATCESCHGPRGQGILALNAPRLSGVDDWYLVRQLENFQRGIRGSHPQDLYGEQMSVVAGTLRDDQAIRDVVAYINTLQQIPD